MINETTPIEKLSSEQAFAELEKIITALESEDHTLDESVGYYERGQLLAKHCTALLETAELKIQQLVGEDLVEFDAE